MARPTPALRSDLSDLESTVTDVLAGVFFGISAALLVIALPLALCNYCRSRRRSAVPILSFWKFEELNDWMDE
ncbi:hypothetical protein F4824DRAFT_503658 [Ustulina deusta]|nr:hypothetical protein F4824DRAFT_503658 [Ustulina deusta]